MRDCPMPRISCSSATESSSSSRRRSRRSRVGSARSRRKLMVDAILHFYDISTYHDWSICCLTVALLKCYIVTTGQSDLPPPIRFNLVTFLTNHFFHPCSDALFLLPNPLAKVIRIKFVTPFPTPSLTLVFGRIVKAASPA